MQGCGGDYGLGPGSTAWCAGAPRLPKLILLGSFSDTLLMISILDIVYDCHLTWGQLFHGCGGAYGLGPRSRAQSVGAPRLPRFILLGSFSDTLLVISFYTQSMIAICSRFCSHEGVKRSFFSMNTFSFWIMEIEWLTFKKYSFNVSVKIFSSWKCHTKRFLSKFQIIQVKLQTIFHLISGTNLEPCQTYIMKLFAKTVNRFQPWF